MSSTPNANENEKKTDCGLKRINLKKKCLCSYNLSSSSATTGSEDVGLETKKIDNNRILVVARCMKEIHRFSFKEDLRKSL